MKKVLSLVLAVVMIMAMAIPAFAASEDAVQPCAAGCVNHTPGTRLNTSYSYAHLGSGTGKKCQQTPIYTYECSVCHLKYTVPGTPVNVYHVEMAVSATCNGTTQTVKYDCYNCKGFYKYGSVRCPNAGHTGNCNWLVA